MEDRIMKNASAITCILFAAITSVTAFSAPKADRIDIHYVTPKTPEHQQIHDALRERQVLERLQEFLSPFKLPRALKISLAGCDGEADAFYGDDDITICYEYIEELWQRMPKETTSSGVEPYDAFVGPLIDTSLHEFGHALIDMHDLPVLGRVEDAADQLAAYIYLQLGPEESLRLIRGTAYAFLYEASSKQAPSMAEYANEHGTPAQRAYNVLCIAYGADPKLFGQIVDEGILPWERAEFCDEEYEQIQDAFEELISPHIDYALAKENFDRSWLSEAKGQSK
jgi:hypothetical protein